MDFIVTKDFYKRSYVLSGKKVFLYRFCDTGFKNKWCGLWAMPHKFLEFFAFKINDEWLSPDNCKTFTHNETSSSHVFEIDGLSAKEFLFVPEESKSLICILTIHNSSNEQKKIILDLQIALNIRDREENWYERKYDTKILENKSVTTSEKGSFVFGSFPSGNLDLVQKYCEHYPSGERQNYFTPCTYSNSLKIDPNSKEDVLFIFSCGNNEKEALLNYENSMKTLGSNFVEKEKKYLGLLSNSNLKTNVDYIDQLFNWSIINLEKLAFDSNLGYGYFAGYPWFTQFWGRDLGWMIPAVIDYGNFEHAKESLKTLARFQSKGNIPNTIFINGRTDYRSIDATPLWIIALHHYITNSGDLSFLNEIKANLLQAIEWCRHRDKDNDGFIETSPKETWMDTLDRSGKPVEIQVFWVEAMRRAGDLIKLLGDSKGSGLIKEESRRVASKFEKEFWNKEENFYFDKIDDGKIKTINPIFALFFDLSKNAEKVLEKIESDEFSSPFGVRTLSKNEDFYNPAGYHTGSVWGWTTALAACAEFKNKRTEKGLNYLNILHNYLNQNCIGAIGEAWNSENNDLILVKENLKEEGCNLQGFSSALVVRCVDECMLGIKVNALDKSIIVSPSLLEGMKITRRKRVGNDIVDLTLQRKNNGLEVKYKSKDNIRYRIIRDQKL